jgi:hypothetical protein
VTAVVLTAVVAVAAVVVAAVALTRTDAVPGPGTASDGAPAAQIEQACRQWISDDAAPERPRPEPGWCAGLTGWMADQMTSGRMMGPGMWRDPDAMTGTCVRAMSGSPAATGDPARWCRDMVAWMREHRGRWVTGDDGWDGWRMGPR